MDKSTTRALQGAFLVTLLLGAQPATAEATLDRELSFDQHGRIVGALATEAIPIGDDDGPGSVPNIKC